MTKRKYAFLSLLFAFIFSFNFATDAYATAAQYYGNTKALPAVIEQNQKKIAKVNTYGPEFVLDYIAESRSYSDITSTLSEIQKLSDSLCAGITDEYQKIKVLAMYVSNTIAYDFDAKHNAVTFDVICLKNVLSKKRTTCAGFSNLFSALCNAQGIYCINIRGSSPEDASGIYRSTLDDEDTPINHEWTAVWYKAESRWAYVDCTWNSANSYSGGKFYYGKASTVFFDISLEYLSIDHKAEIVDYRNFFEAPQAFVTTTTAQTTKATASAGTTKKSSTVSGNVTTVSGNIVTKSDKTVITNSSSGNSGTQSGSDTGIGVVTTVPVTDESGISSTETSESKSGDESVSDSETTSDSKMDNSVQQNDSKDEGKNNLWIIITISVILLAAAILSFFIIKAKKNKTK